MKIFSVVVVFVMLVFIGGRSWGQNLVGNGSFEEYHTCPNSTNQVDSCVGWKNANGSGPYPSPDYFADCSLYPVSVPHNFAGSQLAFDGGAYSGLYTYVWFIPSYREIIGTQLIDSMIPGTTYQVSMRVSRGNYTYDAQNITASNKIGMRFSTFEYTQANPPVINNFAQLYEDSVITDTVNWVLLHWNFIADSAYTHVYIGNFFTDAMTDTINLGWIYGQAYYFIDSINLFCMSGNCATGIEPLNSQSTFFLSPNPVQNLLTINFLSPSALASDETIAVYDVAGRKIVLPTTISNNKAELTTTTLPNGIYLLQIINNKTGMSEVDKFVKE